MMSVQSAAIQVLKEAGKPLHTDEITKLMNKNLSENREPTALAERSTGGFRIGFKSLPQETRLKKNRK